MTFLTSFKKEHGAVHEEACVGIPVCGGDVPVTQWP